MYVFVEFGYYIYIDGKHGKNKDLSTLSSGEIVPSDVQCLTFWYYIAIYDQPSLRVYTRNTRQSSNNMFILSKKSTSRWTKVQLKFQETYIFNIVFEVTNRGKNGEMALDDISIVNTSCKGNQ